MALSGEIAMPQVHPSGVKDRAALENRCARQCTGSEHVLHRIASRAALMRGKAHVRTYAASAPLNPISRYIEKQWTVGLGGRARLPLPHHSIVRVGMARRLGYGCSPRRASIYCGSPSRAIQIDGFIPAKAFNPLYTRASANTWRPMPPGGPERLGGLVSPRPNSRGTRRALVAVGAQWPPGRRRTRGRRGR
jgi:hypothetical protein